MCARYQTSKSNISAINVVNDAAERAVKLGSDFLRTAKSESHYENVLQVVEQDRKNIGQMCVNINFIKTNIKGVLRESVTFIPHELWVSF